jgi:hypothetical protein
VPKPRKRLSAEDKLRCATESFGAEADEALAEPWPDWLLRLATRFVRVFSPEFTLEDFRNRRDHFDGILNGVLFAQFKAAEDLDLSQWPQNPLLDVAKECLVFARTTELKRMKRSLVLAAELQTAKARDFFSGFGRAVSLEGGQSVADAIKDRLEQGQSALICLFLLMNREVIEKRMVPTITELWKCFVIFKRLFNPRWCEGQEVLGQKLKKAKADGGDAARVFASTEQQFRNICSEDGIKLGGKGRPRKSYPSSKPQG